MKPMHLVGHTQLCSRDYNLVGHTGAHMAQIFWTLDPSHSNSDGLLEWVLGCLYERYSEVTLAGG